MNDCFQTNRRGPLSRAYYRVKKIKLRRRKRKQKGIDVARTYFKLSNCYRTAHFNPRNLIFLFESFHLLIEKLGKKFMISLKAPHM